MGGQRAKETVGGTLKVAKGNGALIRAKDIGVKGVATEEAEVRGRKGGAFE